MPSAHEEKQWCAAVAAALFSRTGARNWLRQNADALEGWIGAVDLAVRAGDALADYDAIADWRDPDIDFYSVIDAMADELLADMNVDLSRTARRLLKVDIKTEA